MYFLCNKTSSPTALIAGRRPQQCDEERCGLQCANKHVNTTAYKLITTSTKLVPLRSGVSPPSAAAARENQLRTPAAKGYGHKLVPDSNTSKVHLAALPAIHHSKRYRENCHICRKFG